MPEINPYESPHRDRIPTSRQDKKTGNLSDLQGTFYLQLIALVLTLLAWGMSELSAWGNDIQKYAKYALMAGTVAGILGIVIIVAALKKQKTYWVIFEVLIIATLILCALIRLT